MLHYFVSSYMSVGFKLSLTETFPFVFFQANEFFFFAALLAVVLLVFMVMSYFYKYVYYSVNGEASEDVPLQEKGGKDEVSKGDW